MESTRVSEALWRRAQRGAKPTAGPEQRREEFPLRGFVRCAMCRGHLTASWSRGKLGRRYPYYRCHRCGRVNARSEKLEQLWLDWLADLAPPPGQWEILREEVGEAWRRMNADAVEARQAIERRAATIGQRRERLVESYIYDRAIDLEMYRIHLGKLDAELAEMRGELAAGQVDAIDAAAVLAFAESLLRSAVALWKPAPLEHRQQIQRALAPDGVTFDGEVIRTHGAPGVFRRLPALPSASPQLVLQEAPPWNLVALDQVRRTAIEQGWYR